MVDFLTFNSGYTYKDYMSMSDIDIKKIFYKICYRERYIEKGGQNLSSGFPISEICDHIVCDVWEEIARLRGDDIHNNVSTDMVVSALVDSGVHKDKIHYTNGSFFIPMDNVSWVCNRLVKDFWIQPGKEHNNVHFFLTMNGEDFNSIVKLIIWFDTVVMPLFKKFLLGYERACRNFALKIKKEELTKKLTEESLRIICEDSLTPHGISYMISYIKGRIGFNFNKYSYGKFVMTLEEAEHLFKDPLYMLSKMSSITSSNRYAMFTTHKEFWKWTIIPDKESNGMRRLRQLAKDFLAPHQISVAVSFRDGKAIINAMHVLQASKYDLSLEKAMDLVSDADKVFNLMKQNFDPCNFLNLDKSSVLF
ncbi:MAG: hypothetical protein MJZ16_08210 [Bacteroidales bacterium]|nr:hypothetical protein [Bacteroidales bacterium]